MLRKTFIEMIERRSIEGRIYPQCIIWEDGTRYEIHKIVDVRPRGGKGIRYKVIINGWEKELFLEDKENARWFVEVRKTL